MHNDGVAKSAEIRMSVCTICCTIWYTKIPKIFVALRHIEQIGENLGQTPV